MKLLPLSVLSQVMFGQGMILLVTRRMDEKSTSICALVLLAAGIILSTFYPL